jgi:hypothetical protein
MKFLKPQTQGLIAWNLIRAIRGTMTVEERFACESTRGCPEPFIYVLWHGRMLMPMLSWRNTGVYILVSEHRDGEIVTSSMVSAGYKTIRGSSSRGGARALAGIVKLSRAGKSCCITPDGPRGPKWKFQPGAIYAAAKTGLPIIPLTGSASRAHYFGSWDRFQLPMPFSRGIMLAGEPYFVTGGADPENIEYHRERMEKILTELTLEADSIVGAVEP